MTTPINITTLTFPQLKLKASDASKLRGYFANTFSKDSILFHNHTDESGFRYAYTLVQYKVLKGLPMVVGIGDGARLVMQAFMDIEEIDIAGQRLRVDDKELKVDKVEAGVIDELREYRLATPLFAFNQDNYSAFRKLDREDKPAFLKKLVTSHLIAVLKGMGCEVTKEQRIMVSLRLQEKMVNFNNHPMQMYTGRFTANVALPEGIGIGKSVSKGFGTVVPG